MTPELAPPVLTTTRHYREDVSALDRFNVHRCPTWPVFSGIGLELVTRQATIRYLYHSATAATWEYVKSCGVPNIVTAIPRRGSGISPLDPGTDTVWIPHIRSIQENSEETVISRQ
ncbi:uncharacterized protein TNCV_3417361 [Trichonephila clavipes]|nr:uncharacterized protein TNCV_3417361 [Trichonephila clavipes]